MEIGSAIRLIRTRMMIGQGDFAQLCALSQNALSQIETGRKKPGTSTMTRICKGLGIPLHLLYIIALQEKDVAEGKRNVFNMLHPLIADLAMQLANKRDTLQ